jgi:short-subunit dehydrogenase
VATYYDALPPRDFTEEHVMARQTALITGASSGIGKALAQQFAREDFDIVAVSHDETKLEVAMEELRSRYPSINVTEIVQDLTEPGAAAQVHAAVMQRGITVDILVNDAGEGEGGPFIASALERDTYLIRLNVEAVTGLTKLFLQDMVRRNAGRILNVGSVAGFQPGPLLAVYHATKAYVNSFSEALAEELKDTAVTVTLLCPGATDTRFFETAGLEDSRVHESGTLMEPEKVAEIAFEAVMNGERVIIPGFGNKVMTFTRRLMPLALQAKLNKKFYEVKEE